MNDPAASRLARSLDEIAPAPSVVTIGFFDGVHRGHQTIIGRAVREAAERGVRSVAVTFDRHPMEVVKPGTHPPYLQTLARRVSTLLAQGLDLVLVLPFDYDRSQQAPEEFVAEVLAGPLDATKVVVGANFRFGHKAAGDVVALSDLGEAHGFATEAVTLLHLDDVAISSTAIREHLDAGDVAWATRALGRPHVVEGNVVRGDGRGATIGVPTANVNVAEHLLVPAGGVYAGRAAVTANDPDVAEPPAPGGTPCAINIGTRPTFEGEHVTVEAHLLDTEVDLYGAHLAVSFTDRLRDERRFDGPDELVAQIRADIDDARRRLGV